MQGDSFNFNQPGLKGAIGLLRDSQGIVQKCRTDYDGFVNILAPSWETRGGSARIQRLREFSNSDLTSFYNYFTTLIQSIENTEAPVNQIDEA